MSSMPPLAAIRVFEAAARLGSFTKAATDLGMTQAAVSYQIKVLEEWLGAPLFLRQPRQVVLTDLGRRLSPTVTEALAALRSAFDDIRETADNVLSISSVRSIVEKWLAPRLGQFQVAHPQIAVRVSVENRMVDFAREEIDIGIRSGDGVWPGLEAHFLYPVAFAPVCSPALLERYGGVREPADLLRLPLISSQDSWWPRWFTLAGVEAPDLARRPSIQLDAQHLEGGLAIAGQGIAIVTPALWKEELADGRLVQPFDIVGTSGAYWLVYPAARRRSAKIRAFRDWILPLIGPSLA